MADGAWSRRAAISAVLCAVIAAVQLGIPSRALFEPRPARFGWHMYGTLTPMVEAWTEHANGSLTTVDVMEIIGDTRAEIRWSEPIADLLCEDPEVRAVIVLDRAGEDRIPCA